MSTHAGWSIVLKPLDTFPDLNNSIASVKQRICSDDGYDECQDMVVVHKAADRCKTKKKDGQRCQRQRQAAVDEPGEVGPQRWNLLHAPPMGLC